MSLWGPTQIDVSVPLVFFAPMGSTSPIYIKNSSPIHLFEDYPPMLQWLYRLANLERRRKNEGEKKRKEIKDSILN